MSERPSEERHGCALVTGASRGIGAAIARVLAADGWPVGVNYRADRRGADAVAAAIADAGGRAVALEGDVADASAPDALFAAVEAEFGVPVLTLVNNAGISRDNLSPSLTDEEWNAVIETDLNGAFRMTRRALKGMLRARRGRIVNIASVVGLRANRRPGELRRGQGWPDRTDENRREGGRAPWGHDQRRRAWLDRHRYDGVGLNRSARGGSRSTGRNSG